MYHYKINNYFLSNDKFYTKFLIKLGSNEEIKIF